MSLPRFVIRDSDGLRVDTLPFSAVFLPFVCVGGCVRHIHTCGPLKINVEMCNHMSGSTVVFKAMTLASYSFYSHSHTSTKTRNKHIGRGRDPTPVR